MGDGTEKEEKRKYDKKNKSMRKVKEAGQNSTIVIQERKVTPITTKYLHSLQGAQ